MSGIQGVFFTGVYKTENKLIGILDVEEVLKIDSETHGRHGQFDN